MYLKFSTRLDLSSDLIRRDFHIVQLRLDEELVDIHLHRDTDLVHPTVVGYVHSVAAEAGGQTPPPPPRNSVKSYLAHVRNSPIPQC